jgi:hypothetical protein
MMARTATFTRATLSSLLLTGMAFIGAMDVSPAEASFSKAKYHSKVGICGSKYGPRKYGKTRYGKAFLHVWNKTCWSCPTGYKRTANPNVKGKNACRRAGKTSYKRTKKHKKVKFLGKCPKGQFVHTLNQTCYSCPKGYRRSANPHVAGAKACIRKTKAKLAAGKYRGNAPKGLLCAKGTFYDPRKGGQCWSCPRSHKHRTVNPVTHPKACASKFVQVFAADPGAMCRSAITALRDGGKKAQKFQAKIDKVASVVTKPLSKLMKEIVPDVRSPKELKKIINRLPLDDPRTDRAITELVKIIGNANIQAKITNVIMDPNVVCSGNPKKIVNALVGAGLPRQLKFDRAGLFDNFPIKNAHASHSSRTSRRPFVVLSAAFSAIGRKAGIPVGLGPTITVAIVSDLHQNVRVFVAPGPTFSVKAVPFDKIDKSVSIGVMFFPYASINNFAEFNQLGLELSFSFSRFADLVSRRRGPEARLLCIQKTLEGRRKYLQDKAKGKKFWPDYKKDCKLDLDMTVNFSFDRELFSKPARNIPGIGVSFVPHRDRGGILGDTPEVSFTADNSFKLF